MATPRMTAIVLKRASSFAAHATRGETAPKTRAKLTSDLEGCLKQHRDVRVWRYLTNDTLRGEVEQYIDNELRPRYPEVTIEAWGHKRLADEITKFDIPTIEKVLDVSLGSTAREASPVRVQPDPTEPNTTMLSLLRSGQQAWDVLARAYDYKYMKPNDCTEDELDQLASIFDTMTDWADISGDLHYQSEQRDAQRGLSGLLEDAEQIGFAIFGGRRRMLLTGGVEPPSS